MDIEEMLLMLTKSIVKSKFLSYFFESYILTYFISLWYHGVIDLVKNGACATASVFKDELEELNTHMKEHLDIEYKKSKAVEKYAKQLLKDISDLKKLAKEEKKTIRALEAGSLEQHVDRKDMKVVVKIVKLFAQARNNGKRLN